MRSPRSPAWQRRRGSLPATSAEGSKSRLSKPEKPLLGSAAVVPADAGQGHSPFYWPGFAQPAPRAGPDKGSRTQGMDALDIFDGVLSIPAASTLVTW